MSSDPSLKFGESLLEVCIANVFDPVRYRLVADVPLRGEGAKHLGAELDGLDDGPVIWPGVHHRNEVSVVVLERQPVRASLEDRPVLRLQDLVRFGLQQLLGFLQDAGDAEPHGLGDLLGLGVPGLVDPKQRHFGLLRDDALDLIGGQPKLRGGFFGPRLKLMVRSRLRLGESLPDEHLDSGVDSLA